MVKYCLNSFIFLIHLVLLAECCHRKKFQERVIGGSPTKLQEAPYSISILLNFVFECGAVILSDRWILTAGHCVSSDDDLYRILVGTVDRRIGGMLYEIEKMYPHPDFNVSSKHNDIALGKTKEKIEFNDNVQPIRTARHLPPDHKHVAFSGWGIIKKDPPMRSDRLWSIKLRKISNKRCKKEWHNWDYIYEGSLCTYSKKGCGICSGDSGSPLVYKRKLVGIASWMDPCANYLPDVFTNVVYFTKWLNDIMKN